jgi:hypothetical protein
VEIVCRRDDVAKSGRMGMSIVLVTSLYFVNRVGDWKKGGRGTWIGVS